MISINSLAPGTIIRERYVIPASAIAAGAWGYFFADSKFTEYGQAGYATLPIVFFFQNNGPAISNVTMTIDGNILGSDFDMKEFTWTIFYMNQKPKVNHAHIDFLNGSLGINGTVSAGVFQPIVCYFIYAISDLPI
jgi:hypothetical protein